MNIDKQILKILDNNFCDVDAMGVSKKHLREVTSQIKQSILKAIMKEMSKRSDSPEMIQRLKIVGWIKSAEWSDGYRKGINEFESVIKEVLSEAKK